MSNNILEQIIRVKAEGLEAVKKELTALKNIDAFRDLKKKTEETKKALLDAQATVSKLAKELTSAGPPSKEMIKNFESAKKNAADLKIKFNEQNKELQLLRTSLKQAGISTLSLAEDQKKLKDLLGKKVDIAGAFKTLDMRSFQDIKKEILETQKAFDTLKKSGTLSASEIFKAQQITKNKIQELKNETNGWANQLGKIQTGWLAIGGVLLGLKGAFTTFSDFSQRMAEVRSIAGVTTQQFQAMSDAILEMSKRIPQSASELAAAQYDIISSGVNAEKSAKAVELSAMAAVAGVTDTKTAAQVGVGVMNAYGKSVDDLSGIFDDLFATVKIGVITFPQLSQQLGEVLPVAKASGISIKELGGTIAALTRSGMQPSIAVTALRGALVQLQAPTDEAKKSFEALDITYGNFFETIKQIKEKVGPNLELIRKLIPDIQGAQGVLSLVNNYKQLEEVLAEMNNTAGATREAYNIMADTPANKIKMFKNDVDAISISVGGMVSKALLPAISALRSLIDAIASSGPVVQTLAGAFAALITGAALWNLGLSQIAMGFKGLFLQIVSILPKIGLAITALNLLSASATAAGLALNIVSGTIILLGAAAVVAAIYNFYKMVNVMLDAEEAERNLAKQTDILKDKFADFKNFKIPGNITGKTKQEIDALINDLSKARAYWTAFQAALNVRASKTDMLGNLTDDAKKAQEELKGATQRLNEINSAIANLRSAGTGKAGGASTLGLPDFKDIEKKIKAVTAAYEDQQRAVEEAGLKEKRSTEQISNDKLQIKAKETAAVIALTDEMVKAAIKEYRKDSEQFKAAEKSKEDAVNALKDMRLEALKQYEEAVKKVNDLEASYAEKVKSLQRDIFDVRNKGLDDYSRAQAEVSLADREIAEAQAIIAQEGAASADEIERAKSLLEDARGIYKNQATEIKGIVNGEEKVVQTREEGISKAESGLNKIIEVTKAIAKEETDYWTAHAENAKKTFENIDTLFKATAVSMKNELDGVLKDRDIKINFVPDLDTIKGMFADLTRDEYKTIYIKTVEEKAAGGPAGFERKAGHIPGDGAEDDVPAMLMRGEYVMRKSAVKKYGTAVMNALNAGVLPLDIVPKFAKGGIVALQKTFQAFFPRFAGGGFVDEKLTREIEKADELIKTLQNRLMNVTQYQNSFADHFKAILPKADLSKITKTKKPEDSLKIITDFKTGIGKIKIDVSANYAKWIADAAASGNTDVSDLLGIERDDIESLVDDMYSSLESIADDFKGMIDDLNEQEKETIAEFNDQQKELKEELDAKVAEQEELQRKIRENLDIIKADNTEALRTSGLTQPEIDSYFKDKRVDGTLEDLPSKNRIEIKRKYKILENSGGSTIMDEMTGEIVGRFSWVYDSAGQKQLRNTETGEWFEDFKYPKTSGDFYNPAYLKLGAENINTSKAELEKLKADNKKAVDAMTFQKNTDIADINKQREDGKRKAYDDSTLSFGDYTAGVSIARDNIASEASRVLLDLKGELLDAEAEKKDLLIEFEEARKAWEEEQKQKKQEENAAKITSGGSGSAKSRSMQYFNTGGAVTGEEGADKVPAMLSNGEYVLNSTVSKMLGRSFLDNLNFNLPSFNFPSVSKFAEGGAVDEGGSLQSMGTLNIQMGKSVLPAQVNQKIAKQFIKELKLAGMVTI